MQNERRILGVGIQVAPDQVSQIQYAEGIIKDAERFRFLRVASTNNEALSAILDRETDKISIELATDNACEHDVNLLFDRSIAAATEQGLWLDGAPVNEKG